jgi:quercetin dioxygenase-like cupin family protein
MITRRDVLVAFAAVGSFFNVRAFARSESDVMSSSVFDWTSIMPQPTKIGSTRKFFQAPTATLDELECHVTTLNPGETPHPPHQHPDEEVVIIKEGTVESLVNGQTRRVGPGSVIFQASNQMHGIRNVGDGPATYHVIKWNSPGMLKNRPKTSG